MYTYNLSNQSRPTLLYLLYAQQRLPNSFEQVHRLCPSWAPTNTRTTPAVKDDDDEEIQKPPKILLNTLFVCLLKCAKLKSEIPRPPATFKLCIAPTKSPRIWGCCLLCGYYRIRWSISSYSFIHTQIIINIIDIIILSYPILLSLP